MQNDIADFEKIEEILEDYALGKLIEKNDQTENMTFQEARKFYDK